MRTFLLILLLVPTLAAAQSATPAAAIHILDIVKQIYGFAILHGEVVEQRAKKPT